MAIKHNNVVPNVHFRKWWQRYVKTFFNQAGKKKSRYMKRVRKAAESFPKPTGGLLRPVVHPPTVRYNMKVREGRGFSVEELKAAKIPKKAAKSFGIAFDHRRRNFSKEALEANVARLEEYRSKMILFPTGSKAKKSCGFKDTAKSELKDVMQNTCKTVLPIVRPETIKEAPRAITAEEKAFSAYKALRMGRADVRNVGKIFKIARAKAEKEKQK